MKRWRAVEISLALAFASTGPAVALTLVPGQSGPLNGGALPRGTALASDTQPIGFGNYTVTANVLTDAQTGNLDFIYTYNAAGLQPIDLSISDLSTFATDVNYEILGGPMLPSTALRSVDGTTVSFRDFQFGTDLTWPSLYLRTDATSYGTSTNLVLTIPGEGPPPLSGQSSGGNLVQTVTTLGPEVSGSTPEPGSFSFVLIGASLWALKRRHQKSWG